MSLELQIFVVVVSFFSFFFTKNFYKWGGNDFEIKLFQGVIKNALWEKRR